MASIYKRGGVWWIKYKDAGGMVVRRSLRTKQKRKAENERLAVELDLMEKGRPTGAPLNPELAELWRDYERWAKGNLAPRTLERHGDFWQSMLKITGARFAQEVTPAALERWKLKRQGMGHEASTINRGIHSLSAIFNRVIRLGLWVGPNPVERVDKLRVTSKLPEFFSEGDMLRLLEAARAHDAEPNCRSPYMARVVLLMGWAGVRRSELAIASWDWFLWDKKDGLGRPSAVLRVMGVKDREQRDVPMCERIREEFERDRDRAGYVFESNCRAQSGTARYRFDPENALRRVFDRAGLPKARLFHRLRDSYGSILYRRGVPIVDIARWLGHSKIETTFKHYIGVGVERPDKIDF